MNRIPNYILSGVLLLLFHATASHAAKSQRERLNLNREWKFVLADVKGAEAVNFDTANWTDVSLPHSFSIPYFMWHKVYTGYGWYRKEFDMPKGWKGKNVTLEFEGAFLETEVYLNGNSLGNHVGGYTGFHFDLTPHLQPGRNVIAVRVNNIWKPDVAPRAGDHQFSGGIYRDVWLNITDKLHVDVCGTYITTPEISEETAVCRMLIEVCNNYDTEKKCLVRTEILSPQGKVVAKAESSVLVKAGEKRIVAQNLPRIHQPELWSPESPRLYQAVTTIVTGKRSADQYKTPFGMRWFRWSAEEGFFLNGQHYYLMGANVHQDQAGWGDAVTNAAIRRDVQMIKDAGFNCIRGSHYPHDPAFVQACDEIGLLFFSENAFWGTGGAYGDRFSWTPPTSSGYPANPAYRLKYNESVLKQLKEMIRTFRNNASVAAWSMCNEPFFSDGETYKEMKKLLNQATDSARTWDPSREVAIGGAQRGEIDRLGKNAIAFYNGDGASRPEFQQPGVPNLVSEYGSTMAKRPGRFIPGWGDVIKTPDYKDPWNPPTWRGGQIIWCGFDHGTIFGGGLAIMGMIDYFRLPKRQYYWYVEALKKGNRHPIEPEWPKEGTPHHLMLEASTTLLSSNDGTDDAQLIVTILDRNGKHISNSVPVTLTIVSGPGEFPTGRSIRFMPPSDNEASDISIRDGQAAIAFRSYHAGKTLIHATAEGLEPATIEITTRGKEKWQEGITPEVPDRPYHRFDDGKTATAGNDEEMLLATYRPTWVSSFEPGTNKANVNDGNPSTLWKAAANDKERWWKLALEATYCLHKIQVVVPENKSSAYRYKIEVSTDEIHWNQIIVDRVGEKEERVRTFTGDFGCDIAFVRITFLSDAAGLAEVRIGGKP